MNINIELVTFLAKTIIGDHIFSILYEICLELQIPEITNSYGTERNVRRALIISQTFNGAIREFCVVTSRNFYQGVKI